jgi:pimeloyl-ACP methyl ester carboxylesterase
MPRSWRIACVAALAAWISGCSAVSFIDVSGLASYSDPAKGNGPRLPGRVYILRGLGHIWSRGMTDLADELNRRGTTASAHRHSEWYELATEAIKLHKSNPEQWPIVLIGHSNGADMTLQMASRMKDADVPVALIVAYDPTRIAGDVPSNVARFINLYQATNLLGGGRIHARRDFRGQLINVDLREHFEIGHMNIDKSQRLQREVIAKVLQVVAFPPPPDAANMVSLRYVVPRGEPIELWDGGIPVTLGHGESVEMLGRAYGVPAWAIRQASGLSDDDAPQPGRRLIVPRHLTTLPPTGLTPAFAGGYADDPRHAPR